MADYSLGIKSMTRSVAIGDEGFVDSTTIDDDDVCF
jgi:hypothetical protein